MARPFVALAVVGAALAACSGASEKTFFGLPGTPAEGSGGPGRPGGPDPADAAPVEEDGGSAADEASIFDAGAGDSSALLDASCGTRAPAARSPAYLYIALDGSGSMLDSNKWDNARAAMGQVFDALLAEQDKNLGVGLLVFSDSADPTQGQGPYPTAKDVSVAFVDQAQHDALRARIDQTQPYSGTPTYAVLQGAYGYLRDLAVAPPLPQNGRRVVALVTDGIPTNGATEEQQCTALAVQQFEAQVTTFAVGVGPFPSANTSTYNPAFLGALAKAGGAAPAGCNPNETQNPQNLCFFQVTPGGNPQQLTQAFVAAINEIRRSVASCEIAIDGDVDPARFNVVFQDGSGRERVVPQGNADGWTFDRTPPTKVILHGAACEALRIDHKAQVSFMRGCDTFKG